MIVKSVTNETIEIKEDWKNGQLASITMRVDGVEKHKTEI